MENGFGADYETMNGSKGQTQVRKFPYAILNSKVLPDWFILFLSNDKPFVTRSDLENFQSPEKIFLSVILSLVLSPVSRCPIPCKG